MNYNKVLKFSGIFKKAVDEFDEEIDLSPEQEQSFDEYQEQPEVEQVQEQPAALTYEEGILAEQEQKKEDKSKIEKMEESLINEASSKSTPLERLAKIAKMKRKFAIPAMKTFIEVAEKKQEPLFNYAKDMLYGRIPKYKEEFGIYKGIKKEFDTMNEDEVSDDPYRIINSLFTLWSMALNRAASRKFRGEKGKGRGKSYKSPTSLKNEKAPKGPARMWREEEAEKVVYSPTSEYTSNISRNR